MSRVLRVATVLVAWALLTFGTLPTLALARNTIADGTPTAGTPTAGTPTAGTPTAGDTPDVGDAVPIRDPDSLDEIATITVEDIIDPFESYADYAEPERGSLFVAVEYTVTNEIPNDSIDSPAYDLLVRTEDGQLASSTYVTVTDDADVTALTTDAILGDERTTGTLFYLVADDTGISGIYYADYTSYVLLAGIGEATVPALGEDVTADDADGDEVATLSVTGYEDPFEDAAEYDGPEAGSRLIAVTVSIENLIPNDGIDVSAYQFSLLTSDGLLLSARSIDVSDESELSPLEDDRLGGGESTEGTVFFVVPDDIDVTGVIYRPGSHQIINLGNPDA